ncbi:MAG TPA: hypothetical protein P5137_04375 [Candidatus Brocadiia bacterium]|nr:hypothetical protein [Candidatus Brocadiia bacterium]
MTPTEARVLSWFNTIAARRCYARTKAAAAEWLAIEEREFEEAVRQLRIAGHPICSDGDGYWMSDDPDEVEALAARLRKRALNQLRTYAAVKHTARVLRERRPPPPPRQESLFGALA